MIPAATITWLFRLAPYLAVAAVVFWVMGMRADMTELRHDNATLTSQIATERAERIRNVAALTTLSSGLVAASSAKASDQKALTDAIRDPVPVSGGLSDLMRCLAASDAGKPCAASTGGAAGR